LGYNDYILNLLNFQEKHIMAIDSKELEDFMPATELEWSDTAIARMKNVPFFVRKSVVRGIEQYAKIKVSS